MALKKTDSDAQVAKKEVKKTTRTKTTNQQLHDFSDQTEEKMQKVAGKIETKMDEVADKLTKKAKSVVTPELEKKAGTIAGKVEKIAGKIEDVANEIGTFIPDPSKDHSHSGIVINAVYSEKVSRLFIFRFLWLIVQLPITYIWSIWVGIVYILQLLHMLILGKRNKLLRGKIYRYLSHTTKRQSYIAGFVDEEPKIVEDMPTSDNK